MKMYTGVLIVLIITILISDIFYYFKMKKHGVKPVFQFLNLFPALIFITGFLTLRFLHKDFESHKTTYFFTWFYFFFMIIYIPKILYIIFHFFNCLLKKIIKRKTYFVRYMGQIAAIMVAILMLFGSFSTPKSFELNEVEIHIDNLPESFDGYRIVQISDIHLGSWSNNYNILKPVVDIVNKQNADIIVFSGDMVNNFVEETYGWEPHFSALKSRKGNFAVMGNHDYGDYSQWESQEAKADNLRGIKNAIHDFGFQLLLNESIDIQEGNDRISIVGVENWSKEPHKNYSDLKKALQKTNNESIKILISHDPTHWGAEVREKENIQLMLSGHTHAMQMALKLNGKMYSPASRVYKEWDGLYTENNQHLYVNRGLGQVGMPMRLGAARPEITVLVLRNSKK